MREETRLVNVATLAIAMLVGTTGTARYVGSTVTGAADTTANGAQTLPYATIDYGIGKCTANVGDVLFVMPGHAETITAAAAIAADVAGITIQGLGSGSVMPTVTFGTATTATAVVSADNVTIRGIRFVSNIDSLAVFLTLGANYATVEDCEFVGSSTKEFLNGIGITTTFDNATIRRCKFIQPTDPEGTDGAAGTGAIYLVDSENVLIEDCEFRGNFETAFIHNKTTAAINLWVTNCRGICSLSGAEPFQLVSGATGGAVRCSMITPAEAATTEATLSGTFGAGFFNFQSFFGNDGGGGQLAIASQAAAS